MVTQTRHRRATMTRSGRAAPGSVPGATSPIAPTGQPNSQTESDPRRSRALSGQHHAHFRGSLGETIDLRRTVANPNANKGFRARGPTRSNAMVGN